MTKFFVAMARFSAALTLYSVTQLERSLSLFGGEADVSKTMQDTEKTLTSLSDTLMRGASPQRKETLHSVSNASRTVMDRTVENMEVMDPREMLKASSELLQKVSDVTAKWVAKAEG